jgi:hypothetical protein
MEDASCTGWMNSVNLWNTRLQGQTLQRSKERLLFLSSYSGHQSLSEGGLSGSAIHITLFLEGPEVLGTFLDEGKNKEYGSRKLSIL